MTGYCAVCGGEYEAQASRIISGRRKHCSRECAGEARRRSPSGVEARKKRIRRKAGLLYVVCVESKHTYLKGDDGRTCKVVGPLGPLSVGRFMNHGENVETARHQIRRMALAQYRNGAGRIEA